MNTLYVIVIKKIELKWKENNGSYSNAYTFVSQVVGLDMGVVYWDGAEKFLFWGYDHDHTEKLEVPFRHMRRILRFTRQDSEYFIEEFGLPE